MKIDKRMIFRELKKMVLCAIGFFCVIMVTSPLFSHKMTVGDMVIQAILVSLAMEFFSYLEKIHDKIN
jgi:hypothetical protein